MEDPTIGSAKMPLDGLRLKQYSSSLQDRVEIVFVSDFILTVKITFGFQSWPIS